MSSLEARVVAVVAKVVKTAPENIPLDGDLRELYGLDSLQGLELMAALEKKLDVRVPDEELGCHRTVRDIVRIVEELQVRPRTTPMPMIASASSSE